MDSALFALQSFTLTLPIFGAGLFLLVTIRRGFFHQLNRPIDGYIRIGGVRLFGDNKTWRGVLVYVIFSLLICQGLIFVAVWYPGFVHLAFTINPLVLGLGYSLSYILGELFNSFIKRRIGIAPGVSNGSLVQEIIDNIDGIIVTCLVLVAFFDVSIASVALAAIFGFGMHIAVHLHMKKTGLKAQ